ncbi:MAG: MFS transporter [Desulfobacterales bacterium]|jgi:MFS family permease|nr:MFS transporter [Desulfobacterales bacterium]
MDKKIFAALFSSIFAAVTGVGIVVPLLPVYAHELGASGVYIALIFGGFSLSRTFFLPYFGKLSDKKGRKPFLTIGLFCYFLISLAFMLSDDLNSLVIIRIIQGVASAMIMPVAQAYMGDITPIGKEGISMGMFNMSIFIGLSIGPLLGGAIKDTFTIQAAFACMGILAFGAFCLSYFFLPAMDQERVIMGEYHPVAWRSLIYDRRMVGLFVFRMVYTTCIGIIWGFLPVLADTDFSLSSSAIGFLVMLGIAVSGIMHIPMGIIADRFDKRMLVVAGGLISFVSMFMVSWAGGFWDLFWANIIFGIGGGISQPSIMALAVISGNKLEAMGAVMSLMTVAHSLGMLVGSMFGGLVMDLLNLKYAFGMGGYLLLAGTIVFVAGEYFWKEK